MKILLRHKVENGFITIAHKTEFDVLKAEYGIFGIIKDGNIQFITKKR